MTVIFWFRRDLRVQDNEALAHAIQAVRAVLRDYAELIEVLPARTMVRCHRLTEKRILNILQGKLRPHDVEITRL